jgi:hypothetical protein
MTPEMTDLFFNAVYATLGALYCAAAALIWAGFRQFRRRAAGI